MRRTIKTQRCATKPGQPRKPRAAAEAREESEIIPVTLPEFRLAKILVPVDFSESSRKALHYAASFARQFKAQIILLHVAEPVLPSSPYGAGIVIPFDPEPVRLIAARRLNGWRRELPSTVSVQTTVRLGLPSHEIVQAAVDNTIDLIIIGRQGRTGLAHLLLGGTAEYVLRHAPCPALVVRAQEHDFIAAEEHDASQIQSSSVA